MDKLIKQIHDITLELIETLTEEKYDDFDVLVTNRQALMLKVEELKSKTIENPYSQHAKQLLEETFILDQQLNTQLKEYLTKTKTSIDQVKMKKQVSKKYSPYLEQTDGIFIDAKK